MVEDRASVSVREVGFSLDDRVTKILMALAAIPTFADPLHSLTLADCGFVDVSVVHRDHDSLSVVLPSASRDSLQMSIEKKSFVQATTVQVPGESLLGVEEILTFVQRSADLGQHETVRSIDPDDHVEDPLTLGSMLILTQVGTEPPKDFDEVSHDASRRLAPEAE